MLRLLVDNIQDQAECVICQVVALYLDVMLGRNKSVEAIEKALETVCDVLPNVYAKEVSPASVYVVSNLFNNN